MREDPASPPMTPTTPLPGDPGLPGLPSTAIPVTVTVSSRQPTGDRSTWERLSITPDVEIHVRRPLDRRANKLVERLARIARELFDDEP